MAADCFVLYQQLMQIVYDYGVTCGFVKRVTGRVCLEGDLVNPS
jgi:hypothetical protein